MVKIHIGSVKPGGRILLPCCQTVDILSDLLKIFFVAV
jgi:hypothetical protein